MDVQVELWVRVGLGENEKAAKEEKNRCLHRLAGKSILIRAVNGSIQALNSVINFEA